MNGTFDSYRVEEAYSWHDDIMEITRRIVYGLDEARMSNIAEHFEVDLSEIREFFEMKLRQKMKPLTNYDRLTRKSPEEMAEWLGDMIYPECLCCPAAELGWCEDCHGTMLNWLRSPAEEGET